METVRAKFRCTEVTRLAYGKDEFLYKAKFQPVTTGSKENDIFFKWTPLGQIEIGVMQRDDFVPGKEYYVDFIQAE